MLGSPGVVFVEEVLDADIEALIAERQEGKDFGASRCDLRYISCTRNQVDTKEGVQGGHVITSI